MTVDSEVKSMRTLRCLLAGVFCVVLTTGPGWSSSRAASPNFNCGTLGQSIVKPDGDILVVGEKGPGCFPPRLPSEAFLLQVTRDGVPDHLYSDGGVKFLPDEEPVELMTAGRSGAVLATESSLMKLTAKGLPDRDFGVDGKLAGIPGAVLDSEPILAAVTQSDGMIIVVGGDSARGIVVARFDSGGRLDGQFDGDGISKPAVPSGVDLFGITGIGLDDTGRILISGSDGFNPVALRLLKDGRLDTSFGPDDSGFSAPFKVGGFGGFIGPGSGPFVDGDGAFRAYFPVYQLTGNGHAGFTFDADGEPVGKPRFYSGSEPLIETPDGGVVSGQDYGRGVPPTFSVDNVKPGGSSIPGFPFKLWLTPGNALSRGITYSPESDSLIVTGDADSYECSPGCKGKHLMAVARVDASTGSPRRGFGVGGSILIPENQCHFGHGRSIDAGPWNRCRLKEPAIRIRIRFRQGKSARPGLSGTVALTGPQSLPGVQKRLLFVTLPRRLKTHRKLASHLSVKTLTTVSGRTTASVRGRKLAFRFVPKWSPGDPGESPPTGNPPVRFNFFLKPGALRPLSRAVRRMRLPFHIRARFSSSSRFWAPTSSITDAMAPPVSRRRS